MASGVNLPRISPKHLIDFEIPLPPLGEQRRIAAILDQADVLRQKRREASRGLLTLKGARFDELFGDPASNPKGWPIGNIDDLAASTQYGTSSRASEKGGLPILRMGNITYQGNWDLSDLKYIDLAEREIEKYTARDGDILFNRTNSPDLVGKTAVFREMEPYVFAGYLVRLRVNELADPEFVSAYLNSSYGKATLRGMCKSIIGMANINARELRSIAIPIPPIELQRQFARSVAEIRELGNAYTAHLNQLDALFASLQHRAFRGEL
jgi:type I restriction enzyme, S subunit